MSRDARFFVFVLPDHGPWYLHGEPETGLSVAVTLAKSLVSSRKATRAMVMEVGGRDAYPQFEYRFGARADIAVMG